MSSQPTPQPHASSSHDARTQPLSFSQLVKDKTCRTIRAHPRDLTRVRSVREVREEGVLKVMDAIRDCGWASSVLYASDRGNGKFPVLLEGSHRLEALRRLLKSKDTTWLLRDETPETFKVTLTVLKDLTPEEEARIGREANLINTQHVPVTLVDQLVAMHKALMATRRSRNMKSTDEVTVNMLLEAHPDYQRYSKVTIRAWKRMAEGFSSQARKYLISVHALGIPSGEVKLAFSKKTLIESKMMQELKNFPGVQFWYLKRLVHLERSNKIRQQKAPYFEALVLTLKSFANACKQFAQRLKNTFKLNKLAKCLDEILQTGKPPSDLEKSFRHPVDTFVRNYLWTSNRDEQVHALVELRKNDYRMFPYVFYQLVAQCHFKEDYEEVDKMFAATDVNLQVKFTSPVDPTQENLDYRTLLNTRRKRLLSLHQPSTKDAPAPKRQKLSGERRKEPRSKKLQKDAHKENEGAEREAEAEKRSNEGQPKDQENQEMKQKKSKDKNDDTSKDQDNEGDFDEITPISQSTPTSKPLHKERHNNETSETRRDPEECKSTPKKVQTGANTAPEERDFPNWKTSITVEIFHRKATTSLASTVVKDIKELLQRVQAAPGEKVTLQVHDKEQLTTEESLD